MTAVLSLQQEARLGSYWAGPLLPSVLLYRFPAATSIELLLRAAELVGERTDAWHSRFDAAAGTGWTVAGAEPVATLELGTVSEPASVLAVLDAPVDITAGPLARAVAAKLPRGEVLFGLSVDHLVWDARSTRLTTRRLAETYDGLAAGRREPRIEAGLAYAEFVRRQRREFEGAWGARVRRYWQAMIAECGAYPPVIEGLRPPRAGTRHDVAVDHHLPSAAPARIDRRARRLRISRYAYLLAAVLTTLRAFLDARVGGVLVDAPSRPWPEFAGTVGLFSHGFPVWDRPGAGGWTDTAVEATAARVHAYVGEALACAVPMRPLLRALGTEPQPGRGVMPLVTFEDSSTVPRSAFAHLGGELVVRPEGEGPAGGGGHVLSLRFRELGGGLGVRLETSSHVLPERAAATLLDRLVEVLAA
jgi:hypothetical protein